MAAFPAQAESRAVGWTETTARLSGLSAQRNETQRAGTVGALAIQPASRASCELRVRALRQTTDDLWAEAKAEGKRKCGAEWSGVEWMTS